MNFPSSQTAADTEFTSQSRRVLAGFDIADASHDPGFDDIVQLARHICDAPVALVSLAAGQQVWFKGRSGFDAEDADLDTSICVHALAEPDLLVIPDLTADPRTSDNATVTGGPRFRFYAGAPLKIEGRAFGSLCILDTRPRPGGLPGAKQEALRGLARQVMTQLELRRSLVERERALADRRRSQQELALSQNRVKAEAAYWRSLFERLSEGFLVGEVVRDRHGKVRDWRYIEVNSAWGELVGVDPGTVAGRTVREVIPGIEDAWVDEFADVVESGTSIAFTRQVGPSQRWYEGRAFPLGNDRFGVLFLEITQRVRADARRDALVEIGDRLRDTKSIADAVAESAAVVGCALGVSRAGFGLLDATAELVDISDWTAEGVASIAGRHRFADYGDLLGEILRGEPLIINDVRSDPRTAADPRPMLDLGIGALVNVPVQEHGRTVAVFIVQNQEPRTWAAETIAFLRNVADRITVNVARIRAETEQEILNQELSHRMKNTMAIIQAVALQTLKSVPDRAPVDALMHRLHSLSAAHDVLLTQQWAAANLGAVAGAVIGSVGLAERIRRDGPPFMLGPRATLSLSLLLHELATNALKHGALSVETGSVALTWRIDTDDVPPELVLEWRESGGPPAREPTRKGFGSRLIDMGLVGTGGVALAYAESGLVAEFRAPLEQVQQS